MYVIVKPSVLGDTVPVGMSICTDVSPSDRMPLLQVISKGSISTPGTVSPGESLFQTLFAGERELDRLTP